MKSFPPVAIAFLSPSWGFFIATGLIEDGKPAARFSECSTNRRLSPATRRLLVLVVDSGVLLAEADTPPPAAVRALPVESHATERSNARTSSSLGRCHFMIRGIDYTPNSQPTKQNA